MMLHFTLNTCTFKRGKKIPSSLLDRRGVIANYFKSTSFYFFIFTSVQKEGILKHAKSINYIWKYKDHKYKSNYYIILQTLLNQLHFTFLFLLQYRKKAF